MFSVDYAYEFGFLFAFMSFMMWKGLFLLFVIFRTELYAGEVLHGHRDGYIVDISKEKYTRIYEIPLVTRPNREVKPLNKIIFAPNLTKEFKMRYEQTFGYTDIQRNLNAPNQHAEQEYLPGVWVTPVEDQERRQAFGNYMIKRLSEHHVDNYIKSNPSIRPVYELKERVSNLDLEVKKGYKVKINYSFSGNFLNLYVDNPYDVKTRLTMEMDPNKVGPTEVYETRLFIGYGLTSQVTVSTDYTFVDGDLSLIGTRYLGNNLYATITGVADTREGNGNLNREVLNLQQQALEGERKLLLGLTWTN